jgi:hypothetical protein
LYRFDWPEYTMRLVVIGLSFDFVVTLDPLRGDPRFEKIVASLAPKDVR